MREVGADEAVLFLRRGVVVACAGPGVVGVVVVVAPLGLREVSEMSKCERGWWPTKWFANSRPGTLALEYSKSMTTNCLCWFAGSRSGDSPSGIMRRILPYCVCVMTLADYPTSDKCNSHRCVKRPCAH